MKPSIVYVRDLFPAGSVLALNRQHRLATLYEPSPLVVLSQVQFSQHAYGVLLCLLEAFPDSCSHEELLACLYPKQVVPPHAAGAELDMALRPVYRAVGKANAVLDCLGLTIETVREWGYRLAAQPGDRQER